MKFDLQSLLGGTGPIAPGSGSDLTAVLTGLGGGKSDWANFIPSTGAFGSPFGPGFNNLSAILGQEGGQGINLGPLQLGMISGKLRKRIG